MDWEESKASGSPNRPSSANRRASDLQAPKAGGLSFNFMKTAQPKAEVKGPDPDLARVRALLKEVQKRTLDEAESVEYCRLLFQEGYELEEMIENLLEQFAQGKKLTMTEELVDYFFSYDPNFARRLSQNIKNQSEISMTDYLNRLVTLEHILNTRVTRSKKNTPGFRRPQLSAQQQMGRQLPEADIERIKDLLLGRNKQLLNGVAECVICYDEGDEDMPITKLKCGHEVHKECIDEWFKRSRTCPICRRPQ